MKTGQSTIDQIQDALCEMEDTGFLDDLVNNTEVVGGRRRAAITQNTSNAG